MKIDYNKLMEEELELFKSKKRLLLHSCCAPCSTAVIERLKDYFYLTILYYNPNIFPVEEYEKRKEEQKRLLKELDIGIEFRDIDYDNESFLEMVKGYELEREGGVRCHKCYRLRLEKTANVAKTLDFDYFGTTLTVSPHKNAKIINEIGLELEDKYKIKYLVSDFKKKDGYKRSILLSNKYNLYRQNYCGCRYSININEE